MVYGFAQVGAVPSVRMRSVRPMRLLLSSGTSEGGMAAQGMGVVPHHPTRVGYWCDDDNDNDDHSGGASA